MPPQFCLPDDFTGKFVMNQGTSRSIELPFLSYPVATNIEWFWNKKRLSNKRIQIENDLKFKASIQIRDISMEDCGIYEVLVQNLFGEAQTQFEIEVKGPPGPVCGFQSNLQSVREVLVLWNKPKQDGGCPITGYKIEQKQIGAPSGTVWRGQAKEWTLVYLMNVKDKEIGDNEDLVYLVTGLIEGASYLFGVSAINDCGIGPRTNTTDGILMKSPYGMLLV